MKNFEKLFNQFLTCVDTLRTALNVSYAEALTETFDNLETGKIKVEMGAPDKETVAKLSTMYGELNYEKILRKDKVLIFNYLTLKAITEDGRNVNQMPTPPVLATVTALVMQKLLDMNKELEIVDPALGTGSLLYSVVNQLKSENHSKNNFKLAGIDNDEDMLNIADIGAHLNDLKIDLYCQDAMSSWMIQPADAIISDLPIGYYPLDNNSKQFDLKNEKGHSFAHFLFVEQILKNLKAGAYAFLLVPTGMLSGKDRSKFMPWLTKKVYLNAIIDLPDDMFRNKFNQKSLLVLQNHGENAQARDVFLTKLGSLKKEDSLVEFNLKLNEWYTNLDY